MNPLTEFKNSLSELRSILHTLVPHFDDWWNKLNFRGKETVGDPKETITMTLENFEKAMKQAYNAGHREIVDKLKTPISDKAKEGA